MNGHVGFESLVSQFVNKSRKNGYSFNILCIGETGIGKSTLMETLFNTKFDLKPSTHFESKLSLNKSTYMLKEDNVNLKLSIIETVGYGDHTNKEKEYQVIADYLDTQFEDTIQQELQNYRYFKQIEDTLIHVCLFFISPTGHSLKSIDLLTMKMLQNKVNIVPLIAKADIISKNELVSFKKRLLNDFKENDIKIYELPTDDIDEEINKLNETYSTYQPFAVVGSSDLVKIGNTYKRGRQYEWGTVLVENESHCDFVKLRDMLIRTNMFDLIEKTHSKYLQYYRMKYLKNLGLNDIHDDRLLNIYDVYCVKSIELKTYIQHKEMEIKDEFIKKVKLKEYELKDAEKELNELYIKYKKEHIKMKDTLEEKKRQFEWEKQEFKLRKYNHETLKNAANNFTLTKSCKKR